MAATGCNELSLSFLSIAEPGYRCNAKWEEVFSTQTDRLTAGLISTPSETTVALLMDQRALPAAGDDNIQHRERGKGDNTSEPASAIRIAFCSVIPFCYAV